MQLNELGKGVKTTELPYGILLGDGVCFAETPDGRYYINFSGTEYGFQRVDEKAYRMYLEMFQNPPSVIDVIVE